MTTEYSVSIDWMDEFKEHPDRWINHGRDVLRASCKHYDADKDNLINFKDENPLFNSGYTDKEIFESEEFKEWAENKGTSNIEYQDYCEECDISEDCAEPMMNYGYPLHHEPSEEEKLEVAKETSCTIMENQDTGDFFLVLCGGGMDLSQSIAHAYTICGYIPDALAFNVSSQYGLNISGETYFKVMAKVKESLENTIEAYKNRIVRIDEAVNEAKAKKKN